MEILRPNESLLLLAGRNVAELESEELERYNLQLTKGESYRYDGEGNVYRITSDCVRDEELDNCLVKVEDFYVVDWKSDLESVLGGVNLTNIEQCTSPQKRKSKKGGNRKRRSRRGGFRWGKNQRYVCGVWKRGECEDFCGYEYWVRTPCGREWCPECGKQESLYHRRLYYQILPYVLQMFSQVGSVGCLVVTTTSEIQEASKEDRKPLEKMKRKVWKVCREEGLYPAVYRWHFAGDQGRRWYPHLNILFPMAYIEKEKLERVKRKIERLTGVKVVYYEYVCSLERIAHLVRYVSRPTWNLQDEVEPDKYKYFRKWGVWGRNGELKRVEDVPNRRESEEFWTSFYAVVGLLLEGSERVKESTEPKERVDELMRKIMGLVEKMEEASGVGMEGLVNEVLNEEASGKEALVDSERVLKKLVRRLWARIAEVKGYPMLEEIAGFVVLHGRCIGCFKKIKWKWRKRPFIAQGKRVYKVGWGIWILSDKEDDEEFPF
jgi:hypothetical protein